jgi:hypothetical protein
MDELKHILALKPSQRLPPQLRLLRAYFKDVEKAMVPYLRLQSYEAG